MRSPGRCWRPRWTPPPRCWPATGGPRPGAGWTGWPTSAAATWPIPTPRRAGRGEHPHLIVTLDAATLAAEPAATLRRVPPPATGETAAGPVAPGQRPPDARRRRAGAAGRGGSARVGRRVGRCPGSAGSPESTARRVGCDAHATFVTHRPRRGRDRGRQRSPVLHRRPAPGDDRPRRRPLRRPVPRPADRLGRRPPPGPGRPARPDHHRERGTALPRPPPAAARRPLAAAPTPRRPLPAAPPGHREDHRPRTQPPGHNRPPPRGSTRDAEPP